MHKMNLRYSHQTKNVLLYSKVLRFKGYNQIYNKRSPWWELPCWFLFAFCCYLNDVQTTTFHTHLPTFYSIDVSHVGVTLHNATVSLAVNCSSIQTVSYSLSSAFNLVDLHHAELAIPFAALSCGCFLWEGCRPVGHPQCRSLTTFPHYFCRFF